MANARKADLTVAKLVLSVDIGDAAEVLIGKANCIPPGFFVYGISDPPVTITCLVTLDDTHREAVHWNTCQAPICGP
jgi:hypothetical protein